MSVAASSSSIIPQLGALAAAAESVQSDEPTDLQAGNIKIEAIRAIIPKALLHRTDRLQKLPLDSAWSDFIRRPAVFLSFGLDEDGKPDHIDNYFETDLWSKDQLDAIKQVFASGWKQKSPFVELFDAASKQEEMATAIVAAAAASNAVSLTSITAIADSLTLTHFTFLSMIFILDCRSSTISRT
jgi:hypothetical protein